MPEQNQLNECRNNLQNHEPDHILPFSVNKNWPILPAGLDMIAVQFTYEFLGVQELKKQARRIPSRSRWTSTGIDQAAGIKTEMA